MNIYSIIDEHINSALCQDFKALYYYTPIRTFLEGIVNSNDLILWAGHFDYLEDKMEFEKGMSMIHAIPALDESYQKNIELLKNNKFPFQLSLSQARDCFPLWKIYGHGELAVMLILDYKELHKDYPSISKCIYEGSEEFNIIKTYLLEGDELLTDLQKRADVQFFLALLPFIIKDKHYSYEREVRITHERTTNSTIRYKTIGDIVKPFMELHIRKEVLKGVMLGPCTEEEFMLNKKTLERFLWEKKYEIDIEQSEILIRK